ncbi:DL-endopeptidase inhibitor IseA family protein [Clostridium tyrobutyricum]|uniref:DL-endopeptidase inhibitor IseA family protein n=1 Tax=Clostridium tyrobutyricum TaxID=1519 RepID=UPI002B1EB141|nr:DL-endopeptidase inhibitor IseA family protein [Clostridium tyrobutyricum]MEA5008719.1 DL-endopeptidase inhibitor IseA family protein [Clostridium tyrobutyricum]
MDLLISIQPLILILHLKHFFSNYIKGLYRNYNLNKYYTDSYVNGLVNFVFQKSNDKIYMRYGNPESVVSVDNSQIVSKKYDENKAYITIKENKSYLNVVLIYDGNRWLIDSFNNWGIK